MKTKIFKLIEIDLKKERDRIDKCNFTSKQRRVLHKLVNLFEAGKWQECLDWVNDEKNFGTDKRLECSELEFIGIEIADVLAELSYHNFYTKEELLKEAKAKIKNEN